MTTHSNSCPICQNPPEHVLNEDGLCQCQNCNAVWEVGNEEQAFFVMSDGHLKIGTEAKELWNILVTT